MILLGLVLFIGFVSGSYPSLVLSSCQPTAVLKGTHLQGSKGSSFFRSSLVVSQFSISVALIFCTIVVYKQLHFVRNRELGFIKEHIVTVPNPETSSKAFEYALRQNSQIQDTTASNDLPYDISSASFGEWDGHNREEELVVYRNWVDSNFLSFYNIPIIQGRGFSEDHKDIEEKAYILNEAAVKAIGWDDPIGKRFGFDAQNMGIVVGVVKDFHFAPLHLNIEPLALSPPTERIEWLSIKISPHNIPNTLAFIEKTWKAHSPEGDFRYSFLDDRLDRMYRTEQKLGKTLSYYAFIALSVACLGLFGLASFTTAQRTKEIGIRKVLGATEWNIATLTTKKFLGLVLAANAAAWPIAYFAMHKWLQNFAYRIDIGLWIFILSAVMSIGIALFTVGYQSVKAALASPADSLRHE